LAPGASVALVLMKLANAPTVPLAKKPLVVVDLRSACARSHSLSHNPDSRKIDSIENPVEEWNIHLTGADSVERVEDTVFLNIHVVKRVAEETP
jgi:hypothetical protein